MGYLIGQQAGSLPPPGGFAVVEGGLIGALVLYHVAAAPRDRRDLDLPHDRALAAGRAGGIAFVVLGRPSRPAAGAVRAVELIGPVVLSAMAVVVPTEATACG